MPHPHPGQRWNSTSEPELGLGLVMEADASFVRLLFPAVGEMRSYTWSEDTPLSRFILEPGDTATDQEGNRWVIEHVTVDQEIRTYHGAGQELAEPSLDDRMASQSPLERLQRGDIDPSSAFDHRKAYLEKRHDLASHPGIGFFGARIELLPHQLRLVEEVSRRLSPRVLLADEVGLGKTIEACLLLHQGIRTGRMQRILILMPEALIHQWFVELLRRFHLQFAILHPERIAEASTNPFFHHQWCLCSLETLTHSQQANDWAQAAAWDVVVVDEAHHLSGKPDQPREAYEVVKGLAEQSPGLFLLSATPAQLGEEIYFAQLQLLDPDRYRSFETFQEEQASYGRVADEAATLKAKGDQDAFEHLLRCHGPGRILFRNTRDHIKGFPKRTAHPEYISSSKEDWLQSFLSAHPDDKVLVITQTPEQVRKIAKSVQVYLEPPPVLFHEQQELLVRDRQAAWFADPEGAKVLIASDIGGEGRNFQFVQHLVFLDVPRNPERIEQRIGRLDRIGQQAEIHIHVPVVAGSAEADWVRWVHEGLGAFEQPLSCAQACFRLFEDRLDPVDDALLDDTRKTLATLEQAYREGPQRLITWKHELDAPSSDLLILLKTADRDDELLPFAVQLWQSLGLEVEQLHEEEYLVKAGMFFRGDLSIREEGVRFTTSRTVALAREELDFLTWDHPLLLDAWEASLQTPAGTMSFAHSPELDLPLLETQFVLEAVAPAAFHVSRFFPPTPLGICVNSQGDETDRPQEVLEGSTPTDLLSHPRFVKDWLPQRVSDALDLAVSQSAPLKATAMEQADTQLSAEIKRLEELKDINDHVREEEIEHLRQQRTSILDAIGQIEPRLDALRILLP